MTPDLEALVVAAYVFADEYPVPAEVETSSFAQVAARQSRLSNARACRFGERRKDDPSALRPGRIRILPKARLAWPPMDSPLRAVAAALPPSTRSGPTEYKNAVVARRPGGDARLLRLAATTAILLRS